MHTSRYEELLHKKALINVTIREQSFKEVNSWDFKLTWPGSQGTLRLTGIAPGAEKTVGESQSKAGEELRLSEVIRAKKGENRAPGAPG